jgi:hypothetical protein
MSLDVVRQLDLDHWNPLPVEVPGGGLEETLESGKVLFFPYLNFDFAGDESRFLSEQWSDGKAKNINFRGPDFPLQGAQSSADDIAKLKNLIARFTGHAESLVRGLFPHYQGHLRRGFTSYRTASVEGRETSWRKADFAYQQSSPQPNFKFPPDPAGWCAPIRCCMQSCPASSCWSRLFT